MEKKQVDGRGGARPGAGRPKGTVSKIERKPYCFRLTDEEHAVVNEFIKKMKKKK
ncbi:MAG: hypothetical protein RSC56_08300 [Acidaminococcaceae bacterium]